MRHSADAITPAAPARKKRAKGAGRPPAGQTAAVEATMSGIIHVRDAQGTVRRLLDGCETAKREIRRVYGLVDQLHAVAIQADAEHESAVEVLRSVNRGHRRVA